VTGAALLLSALLLGAAPARPPSPAPERPNIVLIVTDDQDTRSLDAMPAVRARIGQEGIAFENAFVSESLCCPSRATLLTGLYAHNHGVRSNVPPAGGFPAFRSREPSTLATWLQKAGYRTALLGKYLNGYPAPGEERHVPPGWDEWQAVFSSRGSDNYFDYTINENGTLVEYGHAAADYSTDVLAERAVRLLERPAFGDGPFFMLVTPTAPHSSATAAPRHEGLFVGLEMPRGPSFDEEDVSDKPAYVKGQERVGKRELEQLERRFRRRRRTLVAVDEMVERIVSTLEARGLLQRTFVLFTSDNGWFDGEHRFVRGKAAPYDESTRVPLLVRGPGVPRGARREHLVVNVDLAPTLADMAGARPGGDVDGRSLLPLLTSSPPPASSWRQDLLLEYWPLDPEEGIPGFVGLRSARRLYVEYATGEKELYDLPEDPFQLDNVYGKTDKALREQLAQRLARLKDCRGAPCRD
jgi:arylsulfatase A-like enzyme